MPKQSSGVIVPSFVTKVARAKKHLIDLQDAIDAYAATHPYTVRDRIEGKKKRKVRRLSFTADPANTEIPILAADVIYNLRSSLDHLMSCLVPSNQRSSAMFPIYFEGVWEACVPGENEQRCKARARWASDTKAISDAALTVLKSLQPADGSGEEVDLLRLLNKLSNRDRHEKLPVVIGGLSEPRFQFVLPDGTTQSKIGRGLPPAFEDHAEIKGIPNDAMDVKIEGVPLVAIRIGEPEGNLRIPGTLRDIVSRIEQGIFPRLAPFVR
jgi:hypothetical protein